MPIVILESPYAGNIKQHVTYACRAMRDSLSRGETPFASHLLYTQEGILDDNNPEERKTGIEAGYAFWDGVSKMVLYIDYGISNGMREALAKWPLTFECRSIGKNGCEPSDDLTALNGLVLRKHVG